MSKAICPHCLQPTVGLVDRLTARYQTPAICPNCGGASCNGITPASLVAVVALLASCAAAAAWLTGRFDTWKAAIPPFALFAIAAVAIFLHTPLVKQERFALQRNLAIVALIAAIAAAAYFWLKP